MKLYEELAEWWPLISAPPLTLALRPAAGSPGATLAPEVEEATAVLQGQPVNGADEARG